MTAGSALVRAAQVLGLRLDAELLLAHVLDVSRASVVARDDRELTPEELGDFERLLARRAVGEPLAYLVGFKEFWSIELEVTPATLVPRPETELLVEWALALMPRRGDGMHVLDLGTGSGAIALAIARECPRALVTGGDISGDALAVARRNARRLNVGNVNFRHAPYLDAYAQFNLIVSNPPYVAEADPHLADLKFEPRIALTSGADGLDALRIIIAKAPDHLRPEGWLIVEHGAQQGAAVRELFAKAGFGAIETRRDLAGHERATGGRRPVSSRA
ncbi:MAG TPA: peptide chain release factor N(5)-glutamine methyltransferase [Verrucomicrobiae bacterium]|nr:peptide chain release factor N(5)-glutamine methyltransferase [Verrucomicrobiae bacterium]